MNDFDKQTEPTAFSSRVFTRTKIQKPNIFLGGVAKTACCPECGKNEIDDSINYVPLKRSVLPRNKNDNIIYCPKCGLEFDTENKEEMDQVKWVDKSCLE